MFDKLDDLILRYEEVMNLLSEPDVDEGTGKSGTDRRCL